MRPPLCTLAKPAQTTIELSLINEKFSATCFIAYELSSAKSASTNRVRAVVKKKAGSFYAPGPSQILAERR
jgi:hypothetical protein